MLRPIALVSILCTTLALAGCGSSGSSTSAAGSGSAAAPATTTAAGVTPASTTPTLSFEGMPLQSGPELAPASSTGTSTVDNIKCGATEQLVYHIHAHLLVYADGAPRALPAGIGIPGSTAVQTAQGPVAQGGQCIYWLHTHAPDGVIHIESPTRRTYTLGEFFDEWRQPLSADRVASAQGPVTAWLNGRRWTRSPRAIPLTAHADIQLDVGHPTPGFVSVSWAGTGL